MKKGLNKIKEMSSKVANHFCENVSTFSLEEFISIMTTFFVKVKQCQKVGTRYLHNDAIKCNKEKETKVN